MKRITLILSSLLVMTLACQKVITNEQTTDTVDNTFSINAIITDTVPEIPSKTTYENETTFSWISSDVVALIVQNGTYNKYSLCSNGTGSSVTFSTASIGSGYAETGYALYPTNEYFDGSKRVKKDDEIELKYNSGKSISNPLTVTLASEITPDAENPLSVVPLIGKKTGELATAGGTGTINASYSFSTAVGILKFTLNNIPAGANKVTLSVSDSSYPLSGSYTISESGGKCYIEATARTSTSDSDFTKTINFTGTSDTRVFYFPLPVGDADHKISANKLQLTVYNGSTALLTKTIKKDLIISRNTITETPALNIGWTSIGSAKYLDYFITRNTSDLWNWTDKWYVSTELQQLGETNEYRLANPYYVYFGNKYSTGTSPTPWFYFSIASDGRSMSYPRFNTGLSKNNYEIYFTITSSANNKYWGGTYTDPLSLRIAGKYYVYKNSAYQAYDGESKQNEISIVFPNKDVAGPPVAGYYGINGSTTIKIRITKNGDNYALTEYVNGVTKYFEGSLPGTYNSETRLLTFASPQNHKDESGRYFYTGTASSTADIVMKLQYDGWLILGTNFGVGKDNATLSGQSFSGRPHFGEPSFFPLD